MDFLESIAGRLRCRHDGPPIVLLSFNRPHYLGPVVRSLSRQKPRVADTRVHLFQDGAVNPYSGIRHATDEDIDHSVRIFRSYFPNGTVHRSAVNLGICENFLRAEKFAFETLNAPLAYFFEDDLVLSPHYVAALDTIDRAVRDLPVAYFNAFGAHQSPRHVQAANRRKLMPMTHFWGFGLRRSHWLAMQPLLAGFYELVVGTDYRQRPVRAIHEYYRGFRISHPAASQDGAKDLVTHLLGQVRASSFACLGKYIGVEGVNFGRATFEQLGFADAQMSNRSLGDLDKPDIGEIRRWAAAKQAYFEATCRAQLDGRSVA